MNLIDFAGPDEKLDRRLSEFAAAVWGKCRRDPRGGWMLAFGSLLSTNPNDLSFRLRVTREGNGLRLRPFALVMPWTRAKAARIIGRRQAQLASFLGGAEEGPDVLREPFAGWGSGPAALSASFAWVCAGATLAIGVALLATAFATWPLLRATAAEIRTQAALVEAAGAEPLPSTAEAGRAGALFQLAAAFIGGVPLAFFAGLLHALALGASESSMRLSRLPQASFAFLALLLAAALFPFTPLAAIPAALFVPAAVHWAYTAVWSRRREAPRDKARPKKAAVAVGLVFALAALAFMVPPAALGEDLAFRVSLFRDRALLGTPLGKSLSLAYYKTTLYSAWPLKEFFSLSPERPARGRRTAVAPPDRAAELRALGFTLVSDAGAADVVVTPDAVLARGRRVAIQGDLKGALDRVSDEAYSGGMLRQANALGWMAVYYAGPPAVVLFIIGLCCPFVAIMYRAMSFRAATIALGVCAAVTLVLMAAGQASLGELGSLLSRLRTTPTPDVLRPALGHASVVVRHEAAVQAYRHPDPALGEALLKAVDDPDPRVRLWACGALGKSGHPAALPRLLSRLDDVEFFVRYRAAEGLGHLRQRGAIDALRKLMREGSWYEGMYALDALRRIAPGEF